VKTTMRLLVSYKARKIAVQGKTNNFTRKSQVQGSSYIEGVKNTYLGSNNANRKQARFSVVSRKTLSFPCDRHTCCQMIRTYLEENKN